MEVLKLFPLEVFSWDYEKHLMIPRSTEFQSNIDILNLEIYSDLKVLIFVLLLFKFFSIYGETNNTNLLEKLLKVGILYNLYAI